VSAKILCPGNKSIRRVNFAGAVDGGLAAHSYFRLHAFTFQLEILPL
jgi:hypothetical protein